MYVIDLLFSHVYTGIFQAGCKPEIRKMGPGASMIMATPGWGASVQLIVEPGNCNMEDKDQKYMLVNFNILRL